MKETKNNVYDINKMFNIVNDVLNEINLKYANTSKPQSIATKKYNDEDNSNEPILYIILNKDIYTTPGEKLTAISHLTSKFIDSHKYTSWYDNTTPFYMEWIKSYNGYGNTVVLEADEETIYKNCMAKYDNVEFIKLIEDTERVAHHNWKLKLPQHYGFVFFGIKKDMPKWIRQLKLAK